VNPNQIDSWAPRKLNKNRNPNPNKEPCAKKKEKTNNGLLFGYGIFGMVGVLQQCIEVELFNIT
jgi:hypothetical protein